MAFLSHRRKAWKVVSGGGGAGVAIDTVATAVTGNGANLNLNITTAVVGSGANRLLVVATGGGDNVLIDREPDSVTSSLDGALTRLTAATADDGAFCRTEVWYKVAPSTGTHTITIVFSSGGGSTSNAGVNAISFTGVDQGNPFGTPVAVNGSTPSTSPTSGSVTVGTGGMAFAVIYSDSAGTLTITAGTQQWQVLNITSDTSFGGATRTTTGSFTWTTANEIYALSAAPINAAP